MKYQSNSKNLVFLIRNLKMLILSITLLMGLTNTYAQKGNPNKAKKIDKENQINELRKKYLIEKLALTEAEQKAFFPLLDEFKQKDKALRDTFRNRYKPNQIPFMDDKKAEEFLNAMIKLKDDQNNLFKEYILKFRKVLPVKKVVMLPQVEKEFKKEILKKASFKGPKNQDGLPPTGDE